MILASVGKFNLGVVGDVSLWSNADNRLERLYLLPTAIALLIHWP